MNKISLTEIDNNTSLARKTWSEPTVDLISKDSLQSGNLTDYTEGDPSAFTPEDYVS